MTFPLLPESWHPAHQYFDESHILDIFAPKHIAAIPTLRAARLTANSSILGGGKAVSAIFMVAVKEDGHFALFRFRRGGDHPQEIWDFGRSDVDPTQS